MRYLLAFGAICLCFTACRPETFTPKPRGYYHIELPERSYQLFNDPGYPYSFEYPTYGKIVPDKNSNTQNPYWINIEFPSLGGRIYLSYKAINASQPLEKVLSDTYEMTDFHTKRADYIEDMLFSNDSLRVHGMLFNVTGNAASAYQFFATDSSNHYIRGALYFDVTPNADSLQPVNDFLREDIKHILNTLRWK